jgi:hypothetical protein
MVANAIAHSMKALTGQRILIAENEASIALEMEGVLGTLVAKWPGLSAAWRTCAAM